MYQFRTVLFILALAFTHHTYAQKTDSLQIAPKKVTTVSGSMGITNNGFSIVPSFSLNSPATINMFSIRNGKFSFDPDIRFTPNLKKGGIIFWFRYRIIDKKRFSLRVGTHPAFNFALRDITENGATRQITQMRRFIANEIAPNFQIRKNWGVGVYYLNGNGLQKDGPVTLHFLTLNSNIARIPLGGDFKFQFLPAVYYLWLDSKSGTYYTATGIISKKNLPVTITANINKAINTSIAGKDFIWAVGANYVFSKKLVRAD
jgi:hypothetical protein